MRWQGEYVSGISNGIDFDATYSAKHLPGVAWRLLGWEWRWDHETGEREALVGGRIAARMVGDDGVHYFSEDELVQIEDDAYCPECGQIGCNAIGG